MSKIKSILFGLAICAVPALYAQEPLDSLAVDDGMLDEIVVTAVKPVIKSTAEKTTYEAANDPEAKAITLLDLLRKVPGVTVDAEDKISVNGSSNFQVEVDGRTNPMFSQDPGKIFKSIPASMVQRVEVVNTPGARYDAEGVGGVLNIVMKSAGENLDGYSLTLQAEGGTSRQGGSIYAMMQKGRVGVNFSLNAAHSSMPHFDVNMLNINADGSTLQYNSRTKNRFNYGHALLDLNLRLSDADKLILSGGMNIFGIDMSMFSSNIRTAPNFSAPFDYYQNTLTRNHNKGVDAGADYSHIFRGDSRNKLHIAYQFNTQPSNSSNTSDYYGLPVYMAMTRADYLGYPVRYYTHNHDNMPQHIAQGEYQYPFDEHNILEVGTKWTWRNAISEAEALDYRHHTTIGAAFANYSFSSGGYSATAGLRYEHTHLNAHFLKGNGEDFKSNFSNLVPSASVAYNFGGLRTLSAAYTMRISRPGIDYLNPFEDNSNPYQITQGNPYLTPERRNNISLAYADMFGSLMVNTRLEYSFSNDGLTPIITLRDGIDYITFANALHQKNIKLNLYLNWRLGSKTTLQANLSGGYDNMHAQDLGNHGWNLNYWGGLQQKLPWKLTLGANIFGSTRTVSLQGHRSGNFMHFISLGRPFLKDDRLNVSVMVMNPFYGKISFDQYQSGPDFTSTVDMKLNLRSVQLTVSYRFGDLKQHVDSRNSLDSDAATNSSSAPGTSPVGM